MGFVRLSEVAPSIRQDIRYAGAQNFVGRPVRGYRAPVCLLALPAAEALARVQKALQPEGYSLKVYDCYRPQQAVDDFARWAQDHSDQRMKAWFYPFVSKEQLFAQGYIAAQSGHSRGGTVDLSLIPLRSDKASQRVNPAKGANCLHPNRFLFRDDSLDMGTAFDCFDPAAHTDNQKISSRSKRNRQRLKSIMERHGFRNLPEEWWHYTLIQEPYPNRYFNFEVR